MARRSANTRAATCRSRSTSRRMSGPAPHTTSPFASATRSACSTASRSTASPGRSMPPRRCWARSSRRPPAASRPGTRRPAGSSGPWSSSTPPPRASGPLAIRPTWPIAGRASAGRWTGRQTGSPHGRPPTGSRSRSSTRTAGASRAGPGTPSPRRRRNGRPRDRRSGGVGMETPALYRVEARLLDADGGAADLLTATFGMRDVGTRDGRVTLNGQPGLPAGGADQDYYPDTRSTLPSRAFLDDQVGEGAALGLNLLRCHSRSPTRRSSTPPTRPACWCGRGARLEPVQPHRRRGGPEDAHRDGRSPGQPSRHRRRRMINEDSGKDLRRAATAAPAGRRRPAPAPARSDPTDRRQLGLRWAR